jgi:Tfp pilus assembly protein PilF
MRRNRFDDAIKIFHLSTTVDVKNMGGMSYAFTLIGDCYLKSGSKEMAVIYYAKALELDPTNKTAEGMVKELSDEKK